MPGVQAEQATSSMTDCSTMWKIQVGNKKARDGSRLYIYCSNRVKEFQSPFLCNVAGKLCLSDCASVYTRSHRHVWGVVMAALFSH